jgi:hypothetical protein
LEEAVLSWLEKLSASIDSVACWRLSGALCIAAVTEMYCRPYTNTDLAVLRQKPILEGLVDSLQPLGFSLFEKRTYKHWYTSPDKYYLLIPVDVKDAIRDKGKDQNLIFVRFNSMGGLEPNESFQDRINIFLHHEEDSELVSSEDGLHLPPDYFNGPLIGLPNRTNIRGVDLRYLRIIKECLCREKGAHPKHQQDLDFILRYQRGHDPEAAALLEHAGPYLPRP